MNQFLPYKIDKDSEEKFYNQLNNFSDKIFELGKTELNSIIKNKLGSRNYSEKEIKSVLLEILIIGVLWRCHIANALSTNRRELSELRYTEKLTKDASAPEIFRKIYYRMRADVLLHFTNSDTAIAPFSEETFCNLIDWLEATGEYKYELPVFDKWFQYWQNQNFINLSHDLNAILKFTNTFISTGETLLGEFLNPVFFNVYQMTIATNREDFFQVSKPEPEYILNLLAANWLNEINDEKFQAFETKKIMVPGCMRPENGKNCKAQGDGAYLKCTGCNQFCNIYNLLNEASEKNFEVRIALHQSSFKAETGQLKDSGIVGVACAGCLISGGLMLQSKDIFAKCLILNKPGCNKHWANTGEPTNISYSQLNKVLPVCTSSY